VLDYFATRKLKASFDYRDVRMEEHRAVPGGRPRDAKALAPGWGGEGLGACNERGGTRAMPSPSTQGWPREACGGHRQVGATHQPVMNDLISTAVIRLRGISPNAALNSWISPFRAAEPMVSSSFPRLSNSYTAM
jgi:hypothetical protein